ncbi:MAG: hypothetical protein NWR67_03895, partial [Saprospiraceae bacterium]|nr:hypothetical protein [Saprospiraceae bacterium]
EYYLEWQEEVCENEGWISLINAHPHVHEEMFDTRLHYCVNVGEEYNDINWRPMKPLTLFQVVEGLIQRYSGRLISD